ncbi:MULTISPECIES: hypothetical protein [Streptomyces]|uniref:Uncharacterized protein n=1 Tax=Streptomyces bangladeshensis TaxID=295352 RepID=A0ABP5NI40_9ACTN|nr:MULTISPECIES: hypothetical protein [unclassified Streptomyces]MYU28058.1 hypothetical protein [Streptomyces sp. SID7810]OYP18949.1 hypothetical protein CFC35_34355 [Streptomyces sp. FBKL.4005]BCM71703.1 hypothetical protein EASAB2608_07037 [Streptomyces sp. EAS-AB2608]CUW26934.1 hypothetical protein TUE45_01647 [Streptomyces reticuli]
MRNRTKRPPARVAQYRQIVALTGFAICIVTLLVAGWNALGPSAEPRPAGTDSATTAPAEPGDGDLVPDNDGLDRASNGDGESPAEPADPKDPADPASGKATEQNVTAPTTAMNVLTLVIAGVSGTGGFLSGVAALLTVRQTARRAERQQDGPQPT